MDYNKDVENNESMKKLWGGWINQKTTHLW